MCFYASVAQVWDLRQNKLIYNMHGHGDSVTGLSLSSEGSYLLSNSMDNTGYQDSLLTFDGGDFPFFFFPRFINYKHFCLSRPSAYLGRAAVCSQGEVCQDISRQRPQL